MDGRKVCGVRVRVELSPVEDRRRSARGRGGGGGGYESKDAFRGRSGDRDRDKDFSYNKGRGKGYDDDDSSNYRRGDGGRNNDSCDDYQENRYHRGQGRSGSRGGGNYYEQGRGNRGGRGGRDNYGDNFGNKDGGNRDGGGGHGGGNYGSGGGYGMRGSRGGRGGRGGNFRDNNYGYDRSGSRDGHYDDYSSRGRGRGRGRYNKQDNYSGGGWKRDNYGAGARGGGGYRNLDHSERRGGGDMEYREQRASRKEEFEGKSSYKRDGGIASYSKYDKVFSDAGRGGKGDYHEGVGSSHYSKAQQQYSRWDDDFEDEEDGGYRDRSPHHQKGIRHSSGYQKQTKVSRSRSRSYSPSFTSSHSRSQSSSPSLSGGGGRGGRGGSGKRTAQNNRKARSSDYNSSSRSPPISKSRFCSNLPTAYRDTFELGGAFRSDSGYGSHQYPAENRSKLDTNYEQTEHRGYSSKEKRDISSGIRNVHDMSYGSRGDSGHFSKERRGGDANYSDRDYSVLQSSMADVSPPVITHRSSQKRRSRIISRSRSRSQSPLSAN